MNVAQMLLTSCVGYELVGLWIMLVSAGLYFVADSIFKQRATRKQIAEEFDRSQYSVVNFVFDIPGLLVGTYDRFLVPLLNLFSAATLAVMFTVLKPLEVCHFVVCVVSIGLTANAQRAWGCYQSDDISKLKYGTCPEFSDVGVNNVGVLGR